MTIYIDNRVGSKEIAPYIPRRIKHELVRLDYADAMWVGNGPDGPTPIGVERKRLRDFLSSMESGRLVHHQLRGMANACEFSYVVVEGIWRSGRGGVVEIPKGRGQWKTLELGSRGFMASTMDNFANALSCMLNVTVVFTPSLARTAEWMSNIYRWWTAKQWSQHKACAFGKVSCPLPVPLNGTKASLVARVALEFKGVGTDRAMKLGERFDTVRAFCSAGVEELMEVDGIGKGVAESIVREFDKE